MNSRIPVSDETHAIVRDFARGLGVNMNEAVLFLLHIHVSAGDDPMAIGKGLRKEYAGKADDLKKLESEPSE